MLSRPVPSSGEPLPVIGLGTWRTFDQDGNAGAGGSASRNALIETLTAFDAAGGRVVDTSPMYGKAEATLGQLAADLGLGDRLFIATKVWTEGERAGVEQMRRSLALLRREHVDLMQIHNLVDWQTQLRTLRRWKDEGLVRYIGITHYTASAYPALESILRREQVDFVQLAYSPGYRAAERTLLPLASDRGVAVLVNRPFEEGTALRRLGARCVPEDVRAYAASWAEAFLKFIIAQPSVTCVLAATGKPNHLAENLAAGVGRLPTQAEREALAALLA